MSLKGESDFFSTVSTRSRGAAAQLREGRPALAAFLQHVLEMPDVGHRLLRHALDLALLLRAPSGPCTPGSWRGRLVAELAQLAHHLDGLGARRCRECAQVFLGVLGLAGHVEEGGAVRHGVERVLQLEDLHHHGVGVREEQPHLREEPPHVEVVGLLHHELGELQRAGADLGARLAPQPFVCRSMTSISNRPAPLRLLC